MTDITRDAARVSKPSTPLVRQEALDADAPFYLTMVLVASAIVFVGFTPSFYLKSVIHAPPPLSLLTITHGVVFTGWMLLAITQASLIALKKPLPHRQLGIVGALLFGAMITLAYSVAITAGRLGHAPPGAPAPLYFMALPLIAMTAAAVLVGAALWNRRRSDWHKRLMVVSFFLMTGPGTGRLVIPLGLAEQGTWISLGVAELLLVAAIGYDYLTYKRVHPAYWVAGGILAVVHVGVAWAYGSGAWLAFATAITR